MADQVATTNAKLENHQTQLEVQIKERTRSLEDANQVLIETQEQLVRKKKLEVIGQMFGGFAHDIRNPLGAAKNAAFMLSKNLDTIGEPKPKAKRYLAIISDQIERCNGIITDLLDSSQVKTIKLAPTGIEDVLEESVSIWSQNENVQLSNQLANGLHLVMADSEQLQRVILNLANNAQETMPNGGKLTITAMNVDDHVELAVPTVERALAMRTSGKSLIHCLQRRLKASVSD